MANLKDIRRRINSVKSTQKITNAMKLVSAAKFARANHAVHAARPYGEALDRLVGNAIAAETQDIESALLATRPEKKILLVVVATDRGLCGGLNTNLFKRVRSFIQEKEASGVTVDIMACGRRAILFARKFNRPAFDTREKVLDRPQYTGASDLVKVLLGTYLSGQHDRVYLAFAKFRSALVQEPTVSQLLPVAVEGEAALSKAAATNYIVEPSLPELLDPLLMKKVTGTVYRVMLEGAASEHGARMTAMDSATKNAKEVIKRLTLEYNRARQAAITKELIEIVSGAEALN
jgi:F-type H+-transporting ATPase subunit gamma